MPADVLVVDDDPAILAAMASVLELRGVTCQTASSGEEALGAVAARPPTLLILDFNMPGMTGVEVLHRLRAAGVETPAVLMSAALTDLSQRAGELGFQGYLDKPFALADVVRLVDQLAAT
jgi:CheY-like chemotaxis protein